MQHDSVIFILYFKFELSGYTLVTYYDFRIINAKWPLFIVH